MSLYAPLNTRFLARIIQEPYVCAACLSKASRGRESLRITTKRYYGAAPIKNRGPTLSRPQQAAKTKRLKASSLTPRHASNGSLASRSAVNAPTTVPQSYRDLYQRLLVLQDEASSYVDLSRLQLALRSLESSAPITRVALLGLGGNGTIAAGKLARVLLSDALSDQEAFEEEILETVREGRNVLLRYGDAEESVQSNALVRTMNIPSRYLLRHSLELLVTAFNTENDFAPLSDQGSLEDAILSPPLTTPNSADGRVGFVRYPVHKAVLVADGMTGAVEYGRLPAQLAGGNLINAALSVPLHSSTASISSEEQAGQKAVDLDLATHALSLFRESNANGVQYSQEWHTSRVQDLSEWITGPKLRASTLGLKPAIYSLIASILSRASTAISVSEAAETALVEANTVSESKRAALQTAISNWSSGAHRDLQNNLDAAFNDSPSWRRTVWWRLFWRIDDVTTSASNLLRNSWLTEAERSLAFVSGRIFDSGLATESQLTRPDPILLDTSRRNEMEKYEANKAETETVAELLQMPSMLARMQQQSGINALFNPPWPQNINLTRQYMLNSLVPELHRKAQALLVTAFGTIGGSGALGAWFFAATAGHGLYESGAILGLGLVWGLRRLQKKWSKERDDFAISVREDARRVLGEVEAHLRRLVHDGGKSEVRAEDLRSWEGARAAVETTQDALDKLRISS